jgi:hypothetical protein
MTAPPPLRRRLPPPQRAKRPTPSADESALLTVMADDASWHDRRAKLTRVFSIATRVNTWFPGRWGEQSKPLDALDSSLIRDLLAEGVTAFHE